VFFILILRWYWIASVQGDFFVVTKTTWKSFRPHRTHSMDTAYCYSRSSVVRLCVCLCVGHDREPSKNGRTDRDAVGGRTRVGPRNHTLHRAHIGATRWIRWIDLFGGGGAAVATVAVANLLLLLLYCKKVKVARTRLPSVGFRSWSRFLAVSLQVTWIIYLTVDCHYFLPGLQLPPQPLIWLLPVLLLGEQKHNGCEQFA